MSIYISDAVGSVENRKTFSIFIYLQKNGNRFFK